MDSIFHLCTIHKGLKYSIHQGILQSWHPLIYPITWLNNNQVFVWFLSDSWWKVIYSESLWYVRELQYEITYLLLLPSCFISTPSSSAWNDADSKLKTYFFAIQESNVDLPKNSMKRVAILSMLKFRSRLLGEILHQNARKGRHSCTRGRFSAMSYCRVY